MTSKPCCNHIHDVQQFSQDEITARILAAKSECDQRGVRFTPLRQQIYQLILESDTPIGAYDLITKLQQLRLTSKAAPDRKNVAPPTVYRSLEFLLSEGLIHQLTSLNAFVPCCHPRDKHTAAFLICESCQRVQECSSLPVQEIMSFAKDDAGFLVARSVIELAGVCANCQ